MIATTRLASRAAFRQFLHTEAFRDRWLLETHLARCHQDGAAFTVPGVCGVCVAGRDLAVDFEWAWTGPDGLVVPNWRETARCPTCGLNGRQRAIAALVRAEVVARGGGTVYFTERVSPLYAAAAALLGGAEVIGSEYLGPGRERGVEHDGIRHEDAERLSFADASLDVVVSCDVLEHVADPWRMLREFARVLRPGGAALLTFPMELANETTTVRARLVDGRLEHLREAVVHGNPLAAEGSLVFHDFGWDFLGDLGRLEQVAAEVVLYWSYVECLLGVQFYLALRKSPAS